MFEKLEQKIIENLEKTGFPLEVFVASELEDSSWMIYNSPLYRDEETEQSRELDVHAVKVDFSYTHRIPQKSKSGDENKFVQHLVIQCKKTDKPWVFFDNGKTSWPRIPTECFKSKNDEEFHEMSFEELEVFGLKNHRFKKYSLHKSYYEAFSDHKHSSKIYESFITLVKALKFLKKGYGGGNYTIHYFAPIVVLDGTLWSATLKKNAVANPAMALKEVDKLFVVFSQLSRPDKENMSYEEEQIIEVTTRKAFKKNLREIEKDNKELYKCWTNFIITKNSSKHTD